MFLSIRQINSPNFTENLEKLYEDLKDTIWLRTDFFYYYGKIHIT